MVHTAIPYIDLKTEYKQIREQVLRELDRVLGAGEFILREDLSLFESKVGALIGSSHVVGVNSGFDALYMSLRLLGLSGGDEVIVPSYTFSASVAAIVEAGAIPVFADIGPDLNMDPQSVSERISERTKAIMPVHLSGRPCDMDCLCQLAEKHNLTIIEDSAQAFGSTLNDKWLGTFGLFGCFSLHPLKSLSVPGDGGFVVTDNDAYAVRLRELRDHGRSQDGRHSQLGRNSRLDNIHAAIANIKLQYFASWAARRQQVAKCYQRQLKGLSGVEILSTPKNASVVWSTFPLIVVEGIDELEKTLRDQQIEVFRHYRLPVHKMKPFVHMSNNLPVTDMLCERVLYLPIHPFIEDDTVQFICEAIKRALS